MKDKFMDAWITVWVVIALLAVGMTVWAIAREVVLKSRGRIVDANPAYSRFDLNLDGKVNSYDGDICYDIFLGERIATPDMLERADVTKDGLVDDKDVVAIMDAVLGKVKE